MTLRHRDSIYDVATKFTTSQSNLRRRKSAINNIEKFGTYVPLYDWSIL